MSTPDLFALLAVVAWDAFWIGRVVEVLRRRRSYVRVTLAPNPWATMAHSATTLNTESNS